MGKVFDHISDDLVTFVREQHMFFVATAPLSDSGHVNLSPKGLDTFRILSPNRVAYLDMTGSGNETSAHLAENGRITFMFCAFNGAPNIVRFYGTGRTVLPTMPEWDELLPQFTEIVGMRQIIVADITRVQTSCGFAVPLMDFREDRQQLVKYWDNRGPEKVQHYHQEKNLHSVDGLPAPIAALYREENGVENQR
jgi:hypothetical protein